jgi:site-specific recombinase XerD
VTQIAPLITQFLRDYLPRQRGFSPHSNEAYAQGFKLLFLFAEKRTGTRPSQLQVEQLNTSLILAFLDHLETERGNGAVTRNARLAAIRSFMRFVEYQHPPLLAQIAQIRAIPMKRYEQKLVRHLSMEEVRAILNAPDIGTRLGIRDRAMIHLCFGGGLRVSELVGATLSNLVLGAVPSLLVNGKGRKHRNFPLWKETASDLRAWLSVRGDARAPEIFVNAEGRAMTRSGFEYILDKHAAKAALRCPSLAGRSISPHQLRHSCAVIMLEATRDIRKVALWLGHADIRTTEIYLRVDAAQKLEAVEAVIPPELRRGKFKAPDALIAMLTAERVPRRVE